MEMRKAIVPFACMDDLKADFAAFVARDDLNRFQHDIVEKYYKVDLKMEFTPRSLIICATPKYHIRALFHWQGGEYESVVENSASEKDAMAELQKDGGQLFYDYWIPAKRMAVRAGLCEYGRNNITYCQPYGSSITLFVFVSDQPCPEKYTWREVVNMPECESCGLCAAACPTGAILPDRFLIDNEKCLSYWNEWGKDPFPAFIPADCHHRLCDCSICQAVCPQSHFRKEYRETISFSEEETETLLSGVAMADLPEELKKKAEICGMGYCYDSIPRNLRALIEATKLRSAK